MREFLQLAKNYTDQNISGWFVSEKLDGMRAYWDGGISRGIPTDQIKYANTTKDDRRLTMSVATGLWSRYAKPIFAPAWFLDQLPNIPLDGELYLGPGRFQETISVVKQFVPDNRWSDIKYMVFDSPSNYMMFAPGKINNPNCKLEIPNGIERGITALPFYRILDLLNNKVHETSNLYLLPQERLPIREAEEQVLDLLVNISNAGGEGVMLRKPESIWEPKRSANLLKLKKLLDSEGEVVGYRWGKGKLEGMIGSVIVKWGQNTVFELSGFTENERMLVGPCGAPGTLVSADINSSFFPRGSIITFCYTEVSTYGTPLKARYNRPFVS